MSKYRVIQTEFRNLDSLKKALADLGVPYDLAKNPLQPDLPLYGYLGDERPERGSIVIRRSWLDNNWSGNEHMVGLSNDIGFAWDGKELTAQVSEYDESNLGVTAAMKHLRQRYAYHEVMRLAHSHGYNVRESTSQNGQMRVKIVRI
jgi:hypothetical protein